MSQRRDHAAAAAGIAAAAAGIALMLGRDGRSPLDCETIGVGSIAQPAGAWSALAIAVAAVWVAATAAETDPDRDHGIALAAAVVGASAFLAHASAAGWARRLDGFAVALLSMVVLTALVGGKGRRLRPLSVGTAFVGTAAVAFEPVVGPATIAIVAAGIGVAAGAHGRSGRSSVLAFATVTAFGAGGALWYLGRSDGPWCDPGSLRQPHAAWHLMAALAITLLVRYLRSGESQSVTPPTLG